MIIQKQIFAFLTINNRVLFDISKCMKEKQKKKIYTFFLKPIYLQDLSEQQIELNEESDKANKQH